MTPRSATRVGSFGFVFWAALTAVASGCSSGGSPAGTGSGGSVAPGGSIDAGDDVPIGEVSCSGDPRVDPYSANLTKSGTNSLLRFNLVKSNPAPPVKGSNAFQVKIEDMSGTPMSGDLGVTLFMPDHGHGATVQPTITFDPATSSYTLDPMSLFMPGVWRIDLRSYSASADAGPPVDSAVYYFCIEG